MTSPQSSEALEEAREALRKLNRDVTTFRDPAVRRQFHSLQLNSRDGLTASESPAQLKATIISMRTQLHEATEAQKRMESTLFESSKRAAKAEAEVEELEKQLKEKNIEHDAVVKTASERIQALEKESKGAVESARTKAYRLQETLEKDRLGSTNLTVERDRYRSEAKSALAKAAALERELEAENERHKVEKRSLAKEKEAAEIKNAALEEEINHFKNVLRNELESNKETQQRGEHVQNLRNEAAMLRNEVIARDNSAVLMKKTIMDMESTIFTLNRELEDARRKLNELPTLRAELEVLRAHRKEYGTASTHVTALVREKEELTHLIAQLSVKGDVQEGLQILKDASSGGQLIRSHHGSSTDDASLRRELENLRISHGAQISEQQRVLDELKKKCVDQEAQIQHVEAERDQAVAVSKRNATIRRILEHEKTFFRAALEKIESEFDTVGEPKSEVARLRERCTAYEKSAQEYESVVKNLEQNVEEYRAQVGRLSSELSIAKTAEVQAETMHYEFDSLDAKLAQAEKVANEAVEAKNTATANLKETAARLKSVEEELDRLKSSQENHTIPRVPVEELDYDPDTSKVVHMKENPLSQAMKLATAEKEASKGKKRMRRDIDELSPRGDATNATVQDLKSHIEELEAENARLTTSSKVGVRTGELAKKKIEEVRGAVYNLFGWSMRILGAKYTISSIYAEAPGDDLEFGMNESGTMSLIETEYTKRLTDEIDQYVQKMNSIPALLAHITMENFEKTTALI